MRKKKNHSWLNQKVSSAFSLAGLALLTYSSQISFIAVCFDILLRLYHAGKQNANSEGEIC